MVINPLTKIVVILSSGLENWWDLFGKKKLPVQSIICGGGEPYC